MAITNKCDAKLLHCTKCHATALAGCNCGVGYMSAGEWAALNIAKPENAGKSNRALAEETGVGEATIRRERKAQQTASNDAVGRPEKRMGRDGKMRTTKPKPHGREAKARKAVEEAIRKNPGGLSSKDINDATGFKGSTSRSRANELFREGLVNKEETADGVIYTPVEPGDTELDRLKTMNAWLVLKIKDLEKQHTKDQARIAELTAVGDETKGLNEWQWKLKAARKKMEADEINRCQLMHEMHVLFYLPIQERLKKYREEWRNEVWPTWRKEQEDMRYIISARKGVFKAAEFKKLAFCLHPDQYAQRTIAQVTEAFRLLMDHKIALLAEKEMPIMDSYSTGLPKTMEELLARRDAETKRRSEAARNRRKD